MADKERRITPEDLMERLPDGPKTLVGVLDQDSLAYLSRVMPILNEKRTGSTQSAYQQNQRLLQEMVQARGQEKVDRIVDEGKKLGIKITKWTGTEAQGDVFVLENGNLVIKVSQAPRQTEVSFIQNGGIDFSKDSIYGLYYTDIPLSIVGNKFGQISSRDIRQDTDATITFPAAPSKGFHLMDSQALEEFEWYLEEKRRSLAGVVMQSNVAGMNYAVDFRNVRNTSDRYMDFRFPSKDPFFPATMQALFKYCGGAAKIPSIELEAHAKNFSQAVGTIKDTLRVR